MITTSFIGNFTAFQYYMDGYGLEGMHGATHIVGRQISLVMYGHYDADCALPTELGR
jgi:hypothetical protein